MSLILVKEDDLNLDQNREMKMKKLLNLPVKVEEKEEDCFKKKKNNMRRKMRKHE